jgi:hypothetical protein
VMDGEEKEDRLERVRRYNLGEHRDELQRLLAKITGRKITGTIELHLSQGTPAGAMTSREVEKRTE